MGQITFGINKKKKKSFKFQNFSDMNLAYL